MECSCIRGAVRCVFEKEWSCIHVQSKGVPFGKICVVPRSLSFMNHLPMNSSRSCTSPRVKCLSLHLCWVQESRRSLSAHVSLDKDEHLSVPEDSSEELLPGKPDSDQSVQVMGSFDGWSQGEEMSQEYTGAHIKFSANLKLRPGRYEVKFLVDGEWHLSPELPTVGEGLLENNLLIVE